MKILCIIAINFANTDTHSFGSLFLMTYSYSLDKEVYILSHVSFFGLTLFLVLCVFDKEQHGYIYVNEYEEIESETKKKKKKRLFHIFRKQKKGAMGSLTPKRRKSIFFFILMHHFYNTFFYSVFCVEGI